MYQLLNGVLYLRSCFVLPRDFRPANILITSTAISKIGCLGLARLSCDPLRTFFMGAKVIVTIWFRTPKLLLGVKQYNRAIAIDLRAVESVLAELTSLRSILKFKLEEAKMDQKKNVPFQGGHLQEIFDIRGSPNGGFQWEPPQPVSD